MKRTISLKPFLKFGGVVTAVGCGLVTIATARQAAAPVPEKPGVAVGSIKRGSAIVTLTHAYTSGPFESGGPLYMVVLTNGPIPEAAIAAETKIGGQPLLRAGKLQGIALMVDSTGFVRNMVPFIGELQGNKMIASAGQLTSFTVRGGRVTGQGSMTADRTMDQGWSYAASWNATLRPSTSKGQR
jgi:hypothetical protein